MNTEEHLGSQIDRSSDRGYTEGEPTNTGRTTSSEFTEKQEKIHASILKFMEKKDSDLAFSPEFILKQLKPAFKAQNLRVGAYTIEKVLEKSNLIALDEEHTGTVRLSMAKKVVYTFDPDTSIDVNIATIGGQSIKKGQGTLHNVALTSSLELPVRVVYDGIGGWRLHITEIEMPNGRKRKLINVSRGNVEVTENSIISVRDKQKFGDGDILETFDINS